jgi:pyridoxine 4-dehydrogenase
VSNLDKAGRYRLGDHQVRRIGYGAMQLAGPGVFGPPRDRAAAITVLRAAVEAGVDHIDTSDYYGPFVVNDLIREALHPYPDELVLVTKVGARRSSTGEWLPAFSPAELTRAIHDNLRRLGVDAITVNLRAMFSPLGPAEGSLAEQLEVLAELQQQGLIRQIGLSNVTPTQLAEGRSFCAIACVQNHYNLVHRSDDAMLDGLAAHGIPYVPFFPLGGFSPIQSEALARIASEVGATPLQVALAWLLRRSPNILLIPGTSSLGHLRENLAVADLELPPEALATLDAIA